MRKKRKKRKKRRFAPETVEVSKRFECEWIMCQGNETTRTMINIINRLQKMGRKTHRVLIDVIVTRH
jgi:hypothetical protein